MMPKRPDAPVVLMKGAGAIGAFVVLLVVLLVVSPLVVMIGTGWLNDAVPQVPALSFLQSVVACIVARFLVGGPGRTGASA